MSLSTVFFVSHLSTQSPWQSDNAVTTTRAARRLERYQGRRHANTERGHLFKH
jgi:hypothetical protein